MRAGPTAPLCPRYGYAPKGERSHGQAARNRGRNTSILAAMGAAVLLATMIVEGSTNTQVFLTYLDAVLCPALRPGQSVILDNLSVHKNEAVRTKIETAGCRLVFLPAYSPDFNLIEHAFAKLKSFLQSQSPHAGNVGERHRRRTDHHHAKRRLRLVQTLRVPIVLSTILKMAVNPN